jgi:CRISPR system Cascade subunit CasE
MYLTRLTLDPRNAQARRDLGSAYEMHRTLVRAFVENARSIPSRFLWRLEVGRSSWDRPIVLVQSETEGNWPVIERLQNYLQRPVECKEVLLDRLVQPDRRYRFRLLANPTVSRERKRHALAGESEQLAWIERQGNRNGFEVSSSVVTVRDRCHGPGKDNTAIYIERVGFEGLLKSKDTARLSKALVAGIGPAKAFGCGLLSVAPC